MPCTFMCLEWLNVMIYWLATSTCTVIHVYDNPPPSERLERVVLGWHWPIPVATNDGNVLENISLDSWDILSEE
jgi:hypothetical protein